VRGVERDLTALLVMRYNIYSGGLDTARKREAVERIAEAQHRTARLEREVAESTRTAWNALVASRGRADELRNQVSANERVVETYREQFLAARRDLLDLLDAQNELFLSRGDLSTQEYTATFGVYEVFGQMGILLEAMNIAPPSEATPIAAR
jgi:adhesin transport system outer membrane protein